MSLVGEPPLLVGNGSAAGVGSGSGLLEGAGVDETGCLVLPEQPCLSVLLFWSSPFVTAAGLLLAALVAQLLHRALRQDEAMGSGRVPISGRVFIIGTAFAFASIWVSASIAGASLGVSKVRTQRLPRLACWSAPTLG